MGMYNEVSHICPHCAKRDVVSYGESHISQINDGFGHYYLTDLNSLKNQLERKDITADQLKRIANCSTEAWFTCNENSDHTFQADPAVLLAIVMLAERFVIDKTADTISRASALLKELYPD